ncbi:MAG: DUF2760 domain-containing protein [Deltaproteobacteria bacterium]|nr:DUF2760 domain-containing protein [Deltaproteobacteria bacterium]
MDVAPVESLGFGARLWLALTLPFRLLFDGALAAQVEALSQGTAPALPATPEPEPPVVEPAPPETEPEPDTTAALQLLAILQREGRFVDFLEEDVSGFSDADIGAAARVVHEGCSRGLKQVLTIAAVRTEAEGDTVKLAEGFDAARTRMTGNVVGEPPYSGTLAHHGWQVERIELPALTSGHDPSILAPAEVEL